MLFQNKLYNVG